MSTRPPPLEENKETPLSDHEKIKVAVRVRPSLASELVKEHIVVCSKDKTSIKIADHTHLVESRYDAVFNSKTSQSEVYEFA